MPRKRRVGRPKGSKNKSHKSKNVSHSAKPKKRSKKGRKKSKKVGGDMRRHHVDFAE